MCISACPAPTFGNSVTRVCIDICPSKTAYYSFGLFGDPGTSPRVCVPKCLTSGLYRDVANNRTCQSTCTYNSEIKTYRDPTTMTCVSECPSSPIKLYAQGTNSATASCVPSCPTGYINGGAMPCA